MLFVNPTLHKKLSLSTTGYVNFSFAKNSYTVSLFANNLE